MRPLFTEKTDIIVRECPKCNHAITESLRVYAGTFVEIPLGNSLKSYLEVDKLYEQLGYPQERTKENDDAFEDVYDGTEYQKTQKGAHDISLLWNCDELPVFKSSSYQLWPIQRSILELPPLLRNKFTVIAGLWFGYKKPVMDVFLKPFVNSCCNLYTKGLRCVHRVTQVNVVSKVPCISSCDVMLLHAVPFKHVQFNSFLWLWTM